MKVRVISLALAQTHEDAFLQNTSSFGNCLVTSTWSRRTTVSQECRCKPSMGSLLPKKTKAEMQPLKDEKACRQHGRVTGNSHKMKTHSCFQKCYSCSFNNKLSGTLNAMTGNIASFYTSKFHTPLNFTISWICVFSTFLLSMILINVFTFSLEIIQILAI